MAKITFNPNQPIQSLSGTLGCNTCAAQEPHASTTRKVPATNHRGLLPLHCPKTNLGYPRGNEYAKKTP